MGKKNAPKVRVRHHPDANFKYSIRQTGNRNVTLCRNLAELVMFASRLNFNLAETIIVEEDSNGKKVAEWVPNELKDWSHIRDF